MKNLLLPLMLLSGLTALPALAAPSGITWSAAFQAEAGDVPGLSAGDPYTVSISFDPDTFSAAGIGAGADFAFSDYLGSATWTTSWGGSFTSTTSIRVHDGLGGAQNDQLIISADDPNGHTSLNAWGSLATFSGGSLANLNSLASLGNHYGSYDFFPNSSVVWGFDPVVASASVTVPEASLADLGRMSSFF